MLGERRAQRNACSEKGALGRIQSSEFGTWWFESVRVKVQVENAKSEHECSEKARSEIEVFEK